MTYEQIKPYIEKKLISEQRHPLDENIRIFNYTQKCQFAKEWDEVTLQCRGLILNIATGEVIARPFPKFFNYGEYVEKGWPIPNEIPVVYPKFDGSLGILYLFKGEWRVATRGSFVSEQAQWANEFIYRPQNRDWLDDLELDHTHLFEIIYPANRIVVNYDFSGLVHLASIDIATGKSKAPDSFFPLAHHGAFTSFEELEKEEKSNEEGFVLHFPESDVRMKIKFPEYVRLHKIMTGLSEIGIWEMLRDGKDILEIIGEVPDEMHNWIQKVVAVFREKYAEIERIAMQAQMTARAFDTRKDQALSITKSSYPGVTFAMLDGKDYTPIIWKQIRPHGQRVYKVDIDL